MYVQAREINLTNFIDKPLSELETKDRGQASAL